MTGVNGKDKALSQITALELIVDPEPPISQDAVVEVPFRAQQPKPLLAPVQLSLSLAQTLTVLYRFAIQNI